MRRNRIRELSMEVLVGTFMFVALLSLCVFTIVLSRENVFKKTYPFEVVFADVMGLRDGDNVMIRGMIVGKVKAMTLQDEGVHVVAALQRPVHLKKDYSIDVVLSSVLGGRYMQINEGNPALESLAPGTVLKGQTPKDVMALVSAVAADLKEITGKINSGQGTLGKLVNDDTLYNDTRDVVDELKKAVKERGLLKNIEVSMANLNEISDKINHGEGTLGLLVNDESLYNDTRDVVSELKAAVKERGLLKNIEVSMANLNEISDKINHGEGTLGLLVNDESLYLEVKQMINDIRATVDELRETSPIATFTSIFFGVF
jgi:phospholipid/cholesterol/gamma-HCH transport system substrate-binding protein